MFSHITLGVRCLNTAGQFYDAVLEPLGLIRRTVVADGGPAALHFPPRWPTGAYHKVRQG